MAIRHLAGYSVSFTIRLLPRRLRFRAIVTIAAAATPLLRRTRIIRERLAMRMETAREIVTYHSLEVVTRHGVIFDPIVRTTGIEHVEQGLAAGRGVVIVALHAMLSVLVQRALYDRGIMMTTISVGSMIIPGTSEAAPVLEASSGLVWKVRRIVRANEIVGAMIDRDAVRDRRAFEVPTANGPIAVTDALIQLAVRMRASIVFVVGRMSGDEFVLSLWPPSEEEARSAEGVTAAFVAFLTEHVADVAAK